MKRSLYRGLVRLHPLAFRQQFGEEMLCIFDEAAPAEGPGRLLADGFLSLARQWFLRSGFWKVAVAAAGACLQIGAGGLGWPLRLAERGAPFHATAATPEMNDLVQIMVLTIFGIFALVIALVVWTSRFCRQRQ